MKLFGNAFSTRPAALALAVVGSWVLCGIPAEARTGEWTALATPGNQVGQVVSPQGVVVGPNGNVYVSDSLNNRIQMRDSLGTWTVIGTPGAGEGQVVTPQDVAVDADGNLYVADTGNNRVLRRDTEGHWLAIATPGSGAGQVVAPQDVALTPQGTLYVAELALGGRLQRRDAEGNWTIIAGPGTDLGRVLNPRGLAVDAEGNLYVADEAFGGRVQRLVTEGEPSEVAGPGNDPNQVIAPRGLAFDAAGNLYIADSANNRVLRRSAGGDWSVAATPGNQLGQVIAPEDVAVDPDGNLYVADTGNNRVVVFQVTENETLSANPQTVTTPENTPVSVTLTATENYGDVVTFEVLTQPEHGTLSGTGATLTYTPAEDYSGPDAFTFRARVGQAVSEPATVTIEVAAVNAAPVAKDLSVSISEDTPGEVVLDVTDADNDALTYTIVTQPEHGTLSGTAPNLVYTPAKDYNGTDTFTYRASDGKKDSNVATAIITVTPVLDGDLNGDESVNVADVILMLRYVLKVGTLTPAQLAAADMNGDASVNIADVVGALRVALGGQL